MRRFLSIVSVGTLLVVAGCVQMGPSKDRSRFFVLAPQFAAPSAAGAGPVVGVGPVTLPDYLDRNVLVTRVGPNEIHVAASDWWAEPLAAQVPKTLALNIGSRLGASRTVTYPWPRALEPNVTVRVDFTRFEADRAGMANLEATWSADVAGTTRTGSTAATEPIEGATSDASVAALSRLLGRLSDDIVKAIGR
jgi:uncharacterized lipoprotein YmbA